MFGRKKITIETIRERLDRLEADGITELSARQHHDWLFHPFYGDKSAYRKQQAKLIMVVLGLVVGICIMGFPA